MLDELLNTNDPNEKWPAEEMLRAPGIRICSSHSYLYITSPPHTSAYKNCLIWSSQTMTTHRDFRLGAAVSLATEILEFLPCLVDPLRVAERNTRMYAKTRHHFLIFVLLAFMCDSVRVYSAAYYGYENGGDGTWHDANKTWVGDNAMCWAASASNILDWGDGGHRS